MLSPYSAQENVVSIGPLKLTVRVHDMIVMLYPRGQSI